jgi:hypothetical protein
MTESTQRSATRIFVSYRRADAAYPAGWLFDRLVDHYGDDHVFRDVDSIPLGDDFVKEITAAVGSCAVLLTVIGAQWLTAVGEGGQRRLDDPTDFVRLEIEVAFAHGVRVIPVLVDGARMPNVTELPASLAQLAHRQALELSPNRFRSDTARLLKELDRRLSGIAVGPDGTWAGSGWLGHSTEPRAIPADRDRRSETRPPEPPARHRPVQHKPNEGVQPPAAHRNVAGYGRFWIGLLLIIGGWISLLEKVPHKVGYSRAFLSTPHADTDTQIALVALIILGALLLGSSVLSAIRAANAPRYER